MSQVRYRMLSALPEVLDPTINDLFETEIPELELITDLIFDTRRLMLLPELKLTQLVYKKLQRALRMSIT